MLQGKRTFFSLCDSITVQAFSLVWNCPSVSSQFKEADTSILVDMQLPSLFNIVKKKFKVYPFLCVLIS